jgi:hypothetical protein
LPRTRNDEEPLTTAFGKYVIAILLPQATGYLVGGHLRTF